MKNKIVVMTSLIVLSAVALVLLHPAQARSEGNKTAEVKIDNFTFGPVALTVPVNSTVMWVNKDDIPHTVVAKDGAFKSKALDTDQKFSFKFDKPGTYSYYCSVHPKMVGTIVVQ